MEWTESESARTGSDLKRDSNPASLKRLAQHDAVVLRQDELGTQTFEAIDAPDKLVDATEKAQYPKDALDVLRELVATAYVAWPRREKPRKYTDEKNFVDAHRTFDAALKYLIALGGTLDVSEPMFSSGTIAFRARDISSGVKTAVHLAIRSKPHFFAIDDKKVHVFPRGTFASWVENRDTGPLYTDEVTNALRVASAKTEPHRYWGKIVQQFGFGFVDVDALLKNKNDEKVQYDAADSTGQQVVSVDKDSVVLHSTVNKDRFWVYDRVQPEDEAEDAQADDNYVTTENAIADASVTKGCATNFSTHFKKGDQTFKYKDAVVIHDDLYSYVVHEFGTRYTLPAIDVADAELLRFARACGMGSEDLLKQSLNCHVPKETSLAQLKLAVGSVGDDVDYSAYVKYVKNNTADERATKDLARAKKRVSLVPAAAPTATAASTANPAAAPAAAPTANPSSDAVANAFRGVLIGKNVNENKKTLLEHIVPNTKEQQKQQDTTEFVLKMFESAKNSENYFDMNVSTQTICGFSYSFDKPNEKMMFLTVNRNSYENIGDILAEQKFALWDTKYEGQWEDDSTMDCGETKGEKRDMWQVLGRNIVISFKAYEFDIATKEASKTSFTITDLSQIIPIGNKEYRLIAAVMHNGTNIDNGHYVAYVLYDRWYRVSDTTMYHIVDINNPVDRNETPVDTNRTLYLLVYEDTTIIRKSGEPSILENSTNMCWMNAAIQAMRSVKNIEELF